MKRRMESTLPRRLTPGSAPLNQRIRVRIQSRCGCSAASCGDQTSPVGRRPTNTVPRGWPVPIRSEEHTLNSSHVKISYAVFCLKKKKELDFPIHLKATVNRG